MGNQSSLTERSYTEVGATVEKLLGRLTPDELDRLRKDEGYLNQIIQFIKCGRGLIPSVPFTDVKDLLGNNVFGPSEWESVLDSPLSNVAKLQAEWFPWTMENLLAPCPFEPDHRVADTHFAFFGKTNTDKHKLTINGWTELLSEKTDQKILEIDPESYRKVLSGFCEYDDFRDSERCRSEWKLIYMGAASFDPTNIKRGALPEFWQKAQLPSRYRMVRPIEATTSHLLYYLRNKSPWPGNFVIKTKQNLLICKQVAITSWHYDNGNSIRVFALDDREFNDKIGIGAIRIPPASRDPATV